MINEKLEIVNDSFELLDNSVRSVDLTIFNEASVDFEPDATVEEVIVLIRRLAVRRLDYYLHSEEKVGVKGYRAIDRLTKTQQEIIHAAEKLDSSVPTNMFIAEYFSERVNAHTMANPESNIHQPLLWIDVIEKHANDAVNSARTRAELLVE